MYRCNRCKAIFEEPDTERVCLEDYNGVGRMFPDSHYGYFNICPCCGTGDIDEYYESEEDDYDEDEEV